MARDHLGHKRFHGVMNFIKRHLQVVLKQDIKIHVEQKKDFKRKNLYHLLEIGLNINNSQY